MTRSEEALEREVDDLDGTNVLAAALAGVVRPGCVIGLQGDLGAGKTAFTSGFVRALVGGERARVSSPTWSVVQEYPTEPRVRHLDLYRLESEEDLVGTGVEEPEDDLLVVEWPDRVPAMMEMLDVLVLLRTGAGGALSERRVIRIEGRSAAGRSAVQALGEWLAAT